MKSFNPYFTWTYISTKTLTERFRAYAIKEVSILILLGLIFLLYILTKMRCFSCLTVSILILLGLIFLRKELKESLKDIEASFNPYFTWTYISTAWGVMEGGTTKVSFNPYFTWTYISTICNVFRNSVIVRQFQSLFYLDLYFYENTMQEYINNIISVVSILILLGLIFLHLINSL